LAAHIQPVNQMLSIQVVLGDRWLIQFGPYQRDEHGVGLKDYNSMKYWLVPSLYHRRMPAEGQHFDKKIMTIKYLWNSISFHRTESTPPKILDIENRWPVWM
jgi:hypothetical protein